MSIYRRLWFQIRSSWAHLAGLLVLGLLGTPLALMAPIPLKLAVDCVIGGRPVPTLVALVAPQWMLATPYRLLFFSAALMVLATALIYAHTLAVWVWQTYVGEKLLLQFRATLFRHVQRLSLAYHDARGTADSTYRIQYDAPAIQQIVITGLIPLVSAICTLAGMMYVTARLDWELAVVALGVCPPLFVLTRVFSGRLRKQWKSVKKLDSSANSVVQEVLSAMRVVKAFGREEREHDRFMEHSGKRMQGQLRAAFMQGGFDLLVGVTMGLGTAAALVIGVLHIRSGALTIGDLLLVMAYVAQLYDPLKTLSKKLTDIQGALASGERAFALLDEVPEVIERSNSQSLGRARGDIEFRNVCFSYAGSGPVLSNVCLSVPAGARVGIAGQTGAGKSTLISLLMRFYDVSGGQILLDGVDIRDFTLNDLRNQFALMLQDPVLFSTSIIENIRYAKPEANYDEVVGAARAANAHDFILGLPDGYDTQVGERGMRLSGGERQRISLARAFLKNAPILILDEPTSSVDMRTEAVILQGLERLMRGRTTFMIAHRLSTLDDCDLRLEIEHGRVVQAVERGAVAI